MLRITRAIWLTILLVPTAASATTESSIQMGGGPIAVDQGRGHEGHIVVAGAGRDDQFTSLDASGCQLCMNAFVRDQNRRGQNCCISDWTASGLLRRHVADDGRLISNFGQCVYPRQTASSGKSPRRTMPRSK